MGATAVQPAQLVRAPTGFGLYFSLAVTNAAATLVSLLPGGVIPTIYTQNTTGPAGNRYVFKGVWLQSTVALAGAQARYTADGQTVPTAAGVGLPINDPSHSNPTVIMADIQDIQLVCSVAGPSAVSCYLVIGGTTTGDTN